MIKIYISKSNDSNIDDIINVRSLLRNQTDYEFQLSEHIGGTYNPNLVSQADLVLLIPDLTLSQNGNKFTVGKGQDGEVLRYKPTFIWTGNQFRRVIGKEKIPGENWKQYCKLETSIGYSLREVLQYVPSKKTIVKSKAESLITAMQIGECKKLDSYSTDSKYKYLIEE